MPGSLLGTAVVRVEDPELLESRGTYVANLRVDGLLHLRFVRSTVAHARIAAIDTSEAAALPGVVGVFTAADLGLPAHFGIIVLNPAVPRPPLAADTVYFVGDPWPWWWPRRRPGPRTGPRPSSSTTSRWTR
jgi:carbon-monoxide dehydrogenase large subunit